MSARTTSKVLGATQRTLDPMKTCVKVALLSCVVNGFLMTGKYYLGEVSGSMALKADAVHSLADVISSLSILGGILIADRKTKTFPLGLYKVENLVSLVSSLFIFFAAYEIANEAIHAGPPGGDQQSWPGHWRRGFYADRGLRLFSI